MSAIEMIGLTKSYTGGVTAVDRLDLTIAEGEFFALLGPSGCGKTTLLRTIAGLEEATSGRLVMGGVDVTRTPPGTRDVAMVFQDYALFPHMDVADNISYPLKLQRMPMVRRRAKAKETGERLGLANLMDRRPAQLSGGQQQRVALARAIAYRPQVFLFDEPLSNLDARLRLKARSFLKRLQHELRVTTVFVTHDQAEALAMADRIAVMESGRIRQLGSPAEVFHRPVDTFVANFIGSTPMNLLPATRAGAGVQVAGTAIALPHEVCGDAPVGASVTLGIRPEYAALAPRDLPTDLPGGLPGGLPGEVTVVENLGATMLVSVDLGGVSAQALVAEGEQPEAGAPVWFVPDPRRSLVYDDGGLLIGSVPRAGGSARSGR